MGIGEIREIAKNATIEELREYIPVWESDERAGVVKIAESAKKKVAAFEKEAERTYAMQEYERKHAECRYICGIDEVGRGPLAGPVVAAAVILPKNVDIYYLNDSKQLSEKKREQLYKEILEKAVAVGIGFADEKCIDEINILLLNDAVTIPEVTIPQEAIIKGDAKSVSIAAASIVAKVTRDHYMVQMDSVYPGYDFASNKGYGSAKHIEALRNIGPCEIHRRTFIGNFV